MRDDTTELTCGYEQKVQALLDEIRATPPQELTRAALGRCGHPEVVTGHQVWLRQKAGVAETSRI